jgi:hypothetical protein
MKSIFCYNERKKLIGGAAAHHEPAIAGHPAAFLKNRCVFTCESIQHIDDHMTPDHSG